MNSYEVLLSRTYLITVKARNKEEALRYCELYIGEEKDISTIEERRLYQFGINDIQHRINDSIEAKEIENNEK